MQIPVLMDTSVKHSHTWNIAGKRAKRLKEAGNQRICCEIMSFSHSRSYIHKISLTLLSKHEVNKLDPSSYVNVDGKNPGGLNPTQRTVGLLFSKAAGFHLYT